MCRGLVPPKSSPYLDPNSLPMGPYCPRPISVEPLVQLHLLYPHFPYSPFIPVFVVQPIPFIHTIIFFVGSSPQFTSQPQPILCISFLPLACSLSILFHHGQAYCIFKEHPSPTVSLNTYFLSSHKFSRRINVYLHLEVLPPLHPS